MYKRKISRISLSSYNLDKHVSYMYSHLLPHITHKMYPRQLGESWGVGRKEKEMTIKEKLLVWLAYKTPRKLAYWCAVRVMAHATAGKYGDTIVPELRAMEALRRWEEKK